MRSSVVAVAAVAGLVVSGCRGDTTTQQSLGVLSVEPSQVSFADTCAKPADGSAFQVTPPTATLTISNLAVGEISGLTVTNESKDIFVLDTIVDVADPTTNLGEVPSKLSGNQSINLTYRFIPTRSGTTTAKITVAGNNISDKSPNSIPVTFMGQARDLPPQPTYAMSCEAGEVGAINTNSCALWPDKIQTAELYFKSTPIQSERVWDIAITNKGCPDLELSDIKVVSEEEGTSTGETAFTVVDGVTTLKALGGAAPAHLKVAYRPADADGNYGYLVMKTNDPSHPEIKIHLKGYGTNPMCELITDNICQGTNYGCCDFKPAQNFCTGSFKIHNMDGQNKMTVTSVSLRNGGKGMFTLTKVPQAGTEIAKSSELSDAINVDYTAAAEFKSDFIDVVTDLGACAIEIRGGSPAVINSDPAGILDFGELLPAGQQYTKVLKVVNEVKYNKQLDLVVPSIAIKTSSGQIDNQFYSVLANGCGGEIGDAERFAVNAPIPAGQSRKMCVQLNTTNGSQFIDTMELSSNDPNYSTSPFSVTLLGSTECQQNPVALASIKTSTACTDNSGCTAGDPGQQVCAESVCQWNDNNLTVKIPENATDGMEVKLSCATSYDLMPDPNDRKQCTVPDTTEISECHWTIPDVSKIDNSKTAGKDTKELTIWVTRTGLIDINLKVVAADGSWSKATKTVTIVRTGN